MVVAMIPALAFAAPADEEITVFYTNDAHTYIEKGWSYSEIAALKNNAGENALLVDCGDHVQGTAYGSMDEGKTIIELMEKAGYDVATLGNHEFDYGMFRALDIAQNGAVPYVSCNFYNEKDGVRGANVLNS